MPTENAFYKLDKDLKISVKYCDNKILIFPLELNFKPANKRNTQNQNKAKQTLRLVFAMIFQTLPFKSSHLKMM